MTFEIWVFIVFVIIYVGVFLPWGFWDLIEKKRSQETLVERIERLEFELWLEGVFRDWKLSGKYLVKKDGKPYYTPLVPRYRDLEIK